MTSTPGRQCLQCSKPIMGRSDKKYCNQYCRNDYNNLLQKNKSADCIKHINEIMFQNRNILIDLNKKRIFNIKEDNLISMGFNFHFHTHSIKRRSIVIKYCYDIGYVKKSSCISIHNIL